MLFLITFWLLGVIVHFLSHAEFWVGQYLGLCVFGLALFFTLYEFVQHLETTNLSSILLFLVSIYWFLTPAATFVFNTIPLRSTPLVEANNFLSIFVRINFFDYTRPFAAFVRIFFLLFGVIFLWKQSIFGKRISNLLAIFLVILGMVNFWALLYFLTIFNLPLFFLLTLAVMSCDTAAYFIGRLLGQRVFSRNFSRFSPRKTWEGVLAGITVSALTLFLGFEYFVVLPASLPFVVVLIVFFPVFAVLGDLLFSWIKRRLSIDDFSNLIPEHGGLNDRFDSSYIAFLFFSIILCFV